MKEWSQDGALWHALISQLFTSQKHKITTFHQSCRCPYHQSRDIHATVRHVFTLIIFFFPASKEKTRKGKNQTSTVGSAV